ncbi:MAG: alpha/beta hydrolase [Sneathiella sp.]
MTSPPITDPEVAHFIEKTEAAYPADANLASAEENRRFYDDMCEKFRKPHPADIESRDARIEDVPVRWYIPAKVEEDHAVILYAHGGGFVVGSLESHDDVCAEIASSAGVVVISIDYSLAPDHLYPVALDEMERVWRHVAGNTKKAMVVGDSAGGNLSAALCHRMKRLNGPMPVAQVLIYPGLGSDPDTPSRIENAEAPLLRAQDLEFYADLYRGEVGLSDISPEISPLKAKDFSNLPPAFIVTADVDPLRDDGMLYARSLKEAGVEAVWRNEPELVHGYLRARHMSQRAAISFDAICEAIKGYAAV